MEKQVPEINVDELMERIRAEVKRRRAEVNTPLQDVYQNTQLSRGNNIDKWVQVESALDNAEQVSQVGMKLPGMYTFRGWKRKIATYVGKVVLRIAQIITRDQRTFNSSIINAIRAMEMAIKNIEVTMIEKTDHINKQLGSLELAKTEHENSISSILNKIEAAADRLNFFEATQNQIINQIVTQQKTEILNQINNFESQIKVILQKVEYLKKGLLLQEQRLSLLLEEARRRLPEPFSLEQITVFLEKANDLYDILYVQFEDQFRGTREDIKKRQKVYLPVIHDAGAGTVDRPVLDLGCGRGEWLELLKEEGLIAKGVDINKAMVLLCNELGLEVVRADLLEYLRNLPGESLGAVTGFHIVEHLLFEKLIQLLDETVRVLKPGGVAIFETPNPENILVGSCNFYLDPTHRNPLPSSMLKFLAEARGLCRVEIISLHSYPEAFKVSGSELAERFNQYFYGPQDYAVVGWKA